MPRQIQQTGVKVDVIAAPLEHGTFEIVIENHARRTGEVLKGMDVAAKNILHLLIEEKLQVERPRMDKVMTKHDSGRLARPTFTWLKFAQSA